jgi:hypothetical protein
MSPNAVYLAGPSKKNQTNNQPLLSPIPSDPVRAGVAVVHGEPMRKVRGGLRE